MRLAAIYIPSGELTHIFGDNHNGFTLNLGGRNIYNCYVNSNGKHAIKTEKKNESFIDKFIRNDFTLFSAIVGANGTGKSSVLNIFRGHSFCSFIYEDINHNGFEINNDTQNINDFIFYSPHLNIENHNYINGNFKDLSKYEVMLEDTQFEKNGLSAQLELHSSENLKRWIKFIKIPKIDVSLTKIDLPTFDKITIKLNSISINTYQTSSDFIPFFNDFKRIEEIEKENLYEEIRYALDSNDIQPQNNSGDKIDLKLHIVRSVINKVQHILEMSSNKYLREGHLKNNATINTTEFSKINNTKEAFYWFLENAIILGHITFPVNEIKNLIEILLEQIPETDEEIKDWTEIDVSFDNALAIINCYERFIISFKEHFSYDRKKLLVFRPNKNLSSGEKSMYNLFSSLHDYQFKVDENILEEFNDYSKRENHNNNYILLLDEADLGFHPQWKKRFIKSLIDVLPIIFPEKEIQILFTTHDPLTLSDIPKNNVIYLAKNKETNNSYVLNQDQTKNKNTFGANIHDLLADSFFLEDGLMGDFSKEVIKDLIEYLTIDKDESNLNSERSTPTIWTEERALKTINIIDEPFIKERLVSLYNKKFLYNKKDELKLKIQELQVQLKKLNNEEN